MKICSFTQTCTDELLHKFIKHCEKTINRKIIVDKKDGKINFHVVTKNKEHAQIYNEAIKACFYTY